MGMSTLWWIIVGGLAMSAIALTGSLTLVLSRSTLRRLLLPLAAFAAGALLGGAIFHMLPSAVESLEQPFAALLLDQVEGEEPRDEQDVTCIGTTAIAAPRASIRRSGSWCSSRRDSTT